MTTTLNDLAWEGIELGVAGVAIFLMYEAVKCTLKGNSGVAGIGSCMAKSTAGTWFKGFAKFFSVATIPGWIWKLLPEGGFKQGVRGVVHGILKPFGGP